MFERPKRRVPILNTTSTADISFMLLIFFLVTSSMDTDKGLPRQLPPIQETEETVEQKVKQRNILEITLDSENRLTCNNEAITTSELTERIKDFVANKDNDPSLPEKSKRELNYFGLCEVSDRHIIYIKVDRATSYDAYFQLQNAIVNAYSQLRNELALSTFGKPLNRCSSDQRDAIALIYPQRISEDEPTSTATAEKGGRQ